MIQDIRVLDLSDERGQMCGMILSDLGADVICIEPPEGSAARHCGPFADSGTPTHDTSLVWWAWARGKRSAVLDTTNEAGRAALLDLATTADVWIESAAPGALAALGLGYADLARVNPRLVYVSITPYGQDGPKAHWPASDLTLLAASGPLLLTGDDDRAPLRVRIPQSYPHAGAEAAVAALVALHERHASGLGQHVDVSIQQAMTIATNSYIVADRVGDVSSRRFAGGSKAGDFISRMLFPTRDGHVSITHAFGSAVGPATLRLMECVCADGFCDEAMRDKDWVGYYELLDQDPTEMAEFERVKLAIAGWTASKTKAELLELALKRALLIAPANTPEEVLSSPQFLERDFFIQLPRPDGKGVVTACGPWARLTKTPLTMGRSAPRLGEHTDEVLREHKRRAQARPTPVTSPAASSDSSDNLDNPTLPLEGVKVLDFMWAIAGPMSTRILADYGATVIRIESSSRFDVCRTEAPFVNGEIATDGSALFHSANAGKRMMTLDITHPKARETILSLVRWADVVCESFSPGKMEKLGFGYDRLRETKSELIMLSTSLMGGTGPMARFAGYGMLAAAMTGFYELTGWPDRDPAGPFGAYTDYIAPKLNASIILAALEHRRKSGEGQHIDLSQSEVALHWMAPALLASATGGEAWTRAGNRDEELAPHGCYPVSGDDRWIAIAVANDIQWQELCAVIEAESLAVDARFSTPKDRLEHATALDVALAKHTTRFDGAEIEAALVAKGVAAHRVLDSNDLGSDPQLRHRGHFVELAGGGIESVIEASRSTLSRTPARLPTELPAMGADNFRVLSEVLGYDDDRIAELMIAGAVE